MNYTGAEPLESRQLFSNFVDTSFGTNGSTSIKFHLTSTSDIVESVKQIATDSIGRSYVLAQLSTTTQVERINSDGTLDTTWGKKGALAFLNKVVGGGAVSMKIDAAERLDILVGPYLYRYGTSGKIDTTFNGAGYVKMADFTAPAAIDVDASNRIYVTGSTSGTKMRVERLLARGKLDSAFGTRGVVDLPLPPSTASETGIQADGTDVRVLTDGDVMVAGSISADGRGSGVEAVRVLSSGAVDTSYGNQGTAGGPDAVTDIDSFSSQVNGIRPDGVVDLVNVDDGTDGASSGYSQFLASGQIAATGDSYARGVAEPDGGELIQTTGGLLRLLAHGSVEHNFNGGALIRAHDPFTLTVDGSLLVSQRSTTQGRVSVTRYLPAVDPANV